MRQPQVVNSNQMQAAGAVSAHNPRDGMKGSGTAAAMGFGGGSQFDGRTTTASQFGAYVLSLVRCAVLRSC